MKTATHPSEATLASPEKKAPSFTPLELETRVAVDTGCAAHHLNRRPQTLRAWACRQNGPLLPIRVNGRLAWPVADLRRLLNLAG